MCFDIDLRIPGSLPVKILSVRRGTPVWCSLHTWRSEDSSLSSLLPPCGPWGSHLRLQATTFSLPLLSLGYFSKNFCLREDASSLRCLLLDEWIISMFSVFIAVYSTTFLCLIYWALKNAVWDQSVFKHRVGRGSRASPLTEMLWTIDGFWGGGGGSQFSLRM